MGNWTHMQVLTAWSTVEQHAEAWVENLPPEFAHLGEGVVGTFAERARKHHHPAFEAAYALDPINFEKVEGLDEHAHPKILTQGDAVLDEIKVGGWGEDLSVYADDLRVFLSFSICRALLSSRAHRLSR